MTEFGWEVDPKAQDDGEWKSFDHLMPGLEVLLRSVRSPIYRRSLSKLQAMDPQWNRRGRKAEEYRDLKTRELVADHLIIEWRRKEEDGSYGPMRARNGSAVECTAAMRRELMTDRAHQRFADAVFTAYPRRRTRLSPSSTTCPTRR
jgi:hypothetical protein